MCLENLALSKELAKSSEETYFIIQDSFESALKRVEYFYPTGPISREQVRLDQDIEDKKVVSLMD